jgi:hypothetical protein
MPRWWEWLGRVLWTLVTMVVVGFLVFVLGTAWVASYVRGGPRGSDYDAQIGASLNVLVVAGVVSFGSGVAFWHRYPSTLRRRGIGWGSD